jgi:hypothetical protein
MTASRTAARAATDRRVEATTTLTVSITAAEQQQKQLQKETTTTEQRLELATNYNSDSINQSCQSRSNDKEQ